LENFELIIRVEQSRLDESLVEIEVLKKEKEDLADGNLALEFDLAMHTEDKATQFDERVIELTTINIEQQRIIKDLQKQLLAANSMSTTNSR